MAVRFGWLGLIPVAAALFVARETGKAQAEERQRDVFAAIEYSRLPGDSDAGRERAARLVAEAARRGARFVVLPELSLTGPFRAGDTSPTAVAEPIPGPSTAYFGLLSRGFKIFLAASLPEKAANGGGHFVTTVLFGDDGSIIQRQRKVIPRLNGEDGTTLLRGDPRIPLTSAVACDRRIGILSGDDLMTGVPRLASRGADTILVTANWTAGEPIDWEQLCRSLSRRYPVNLVAANWPSDPQAGEASVCRRCFICSRDGELLGREIRVPEGTIWLAPLPPVPPPLQVVEQPLGLPPVPLPTFYPLTEELVELGRELFFDPRLSRDGKVSCATCHQPSRAFASNDRTAVGVFGRRGGRNVPSLLNVGFKERLFWDGSSATLELQAKFPMSNEAEMDFHYLEVAEYVSQQPRYVNFVRPGKVEFEDIARALASYQRTLLSGDSAFDRFYYAQEPGALHSSAQLGFRLFTGKAHCSVCHQIGKEYALFTDHKAHNTGYGYGKRGFSDLGVGTVSDSSDSGFFVTPSLRNVALTPPYMHDGGIATLEQVVAFYNKGGIRNPALDLDIRPLHLNQRESSALVEFLRSLTGSHQYSSDGKRISPDVMTSGSAPRRKSKLREDASTQEK